ncbi:hypothetical protein [Aureimonas psammosilenae]|uniref:hypothetical protein n=1 Tax=Aureimonas psammosilenae TaxID=2495496 RepID=UPI0012610864|nr:hypothetical protein [Aureimonas psammosilenae]
MARFIRTLCRLPLLVAVLATALALGFGTPSLAAAGLGPAVVETADVSGVDASAPETAADLSPDEPGADPQAATDAVLCEAPALSRPRPDHPAIARTDPEFPSRLASLHRPPSPARPAMRGGRSG